jgi:hypothetical protein
MKNKNKSLSCRPRLREEEWGNTWKSGAFSTICRCSLRTAKAHLNQHCLPSLPEPATFQTMKEPRTLNGKTLV